MTPLLAVLVPWFDRTATLVPMLSLPLLLLAILAWGRVALLRHAVASDGFVRLALAAGAATILLYVGQITVYLAYPAYVDHVQTTITVMSYMAIHGGSVYSSADGSAIYGMPYGPTLFLLNGIGLWFDQSVWGSKLPGIAALLSALAVMLACWRRRDRVTACLALATFVALLLPYGPLAYWNRPEPYLLLSATLALAALRLRRFAADLAVGALLGFAAGLKLNGFLFVAPVALALAGRNAGWGQRAGSLTVQAVVGAVVFLAPFALPNVSLADYGRYLSMGAGHGLDPLMLWTSAALAGAFVGPVVLLYAWRRPALAAEDRWLLVGFLAATAATVLVAGRVQAGAYHILPMIPVGLYATAAVADPALAAHPRPLTRRSFWAAGFMLTLLIGGTGLLRNYGGLSVVEFLQGRPAMTEAVVELDDLAARFPGAQMAVSDDDNYWLAMQGAVLVMRSGRIAIDYASWMDLVFVGANSSRLMGFVEGCRTPAWIMPIAGAPFSLTSIYTGAPLFSDEFRRRFLDNYVEVATGRFYRVWTCSAG